MTKADVRTIDGSGNNLANPTWGAAGTKLPRLGGAIYDDGMNSPTGTTRPNPRTISNALSAQPGSIVSQRGLSDFIWQWGQFIDHDIGLTLTNPQEPMVIGNLNPADPLFPMIPMSRSESDPGTGDDPNSPRQQMNSNTSFLDASMVYGSDTVRASALRTFAGGKLVTTAGDMLPKNTLGLPNANDVGADPTTLYLAGDVRANEQTGLIAMHTIFVREHNHWAEHLAAANPGWSDEEIYQHARRIVSGEIQAITYNEFLPALMGNHAPSLSNAQYDETVDASIVNEFSTAIYRLGHSMVSPTLKRLDLGGQPSADGDLALRDAFFNTTLMADSDQLDQIMRGMSRQTMQEIDLLVVDELRNNLFGPPGSGGLDLAALNIMRGRDHGLPDYNALRQWLGLSEMTAFTDITTDADIAAALEGLYASVDDIDPWVGMLAEDHLAGASVGETLAAGMAVQFERLRDGDRFLFEFDDDLTEAEKSLIRGTSLAEVLMRNSNVGPLQSNVFFAIPEPSSLAMMLFCGLLLFGGNRRWRA